MSDRAFLDSNILLYAVSDGPQARAAQNAARASQVISVQVLNEFTNVARRKLGRGIDEIRSTAAGFTAAFEVRPITLEMYDGALNIAQRYGFGFYDALIVAAALDAQCDVLYTEDLQHEQVIEDRLRIVNPFLSPRHAN